MGTQNNPQEILVIKLGALGDFIQALGPMAAIKKHHKGAKITLLTTKPFRDMAESCGYFDHIWIDEKLSWINMASWIKFGKKLNNADFTRVYDLQNNDRTSLYFKLFKQKPEWVGAVKGASHRNDSPERTAGHAFDGHVQTLKLAGIKTVQIDDLSWMKADLSAFALRRPYVLIVPGSAPNRLEKRWPADKYGRLAKLILSSGFQPVLLGTDSEKDITRVIARICPEAYDLTGQTSLFQIAALAREADGAIGNDTGPMHLIAATGCPCLALFSSHSNPIKHAPKGGDVQILQKENLANLRSEEVLRKFKPKKHPAKPSVTMH